MGKILILHVEDDPANRMLARDILEFHGHQVVEVIDGDDALATTEQERPDLILIDIQLPFISRLEATRRIRASAQLRNIPIIAVTSLGSPGTGHREAVDAYLGEPYTLKDLLQLIQKLLPR